MPTIPAFAIRDGYWYPPDTIFVNPRQGAPSGYTFTDPRTLNPSPDQWVKRGSNSFWELTNTAPLWDIAWYEERKAEALLAKRQQLELSFNDRLTLGMPYDFGATGEAAKLPVNNTTVKLRRRDQTIIQELEIDASSGLLHVQARSNDRSNLQAIESSLTLLSNITANPTISFVMAENVAIPLNIALWESVATAMIVWYGAIFGECGTYKAVLDSYDNIQDINDFTWSWQN